MANRCIELTANSTTISLKANSPRLLHLFGTSRIYLETKISEMLSMMSKPFKKISAMYRTIEVETS